MQTIIDSKDGVLWIGVSGRFADGNATEFAEAVASAIDDDVRAVILDCGQLSHFGGMGIRALIMTARHLLQRDTASMLCAPSNVLRVALHVSSIDRIAPIHPTVAEAVALASIASALAAVRTSARLDRKRNLTPTDPACHGRLRRHAAARKRSAVTGRGAGGPARGCVCRSGTRTAGSRR